MSALENLSTLQGKGGGTDNEKLIFKVMKRGEQLEKALQSQSEIADLGLRFDLTLPLARYYANSQSTLPRPFKVFQMGSVWRADRPQKGRYREFTQCDVDILGSKEIGAEADAISAIVEVFHHYGLEGVEVHINDRRLLAKWGESLMVAPDVWAQVLVVLDKLDKIAVDGVCKELFEKNLLNSDQQKKFETLLRAAENAKAEDFQSLDTESVGSMLELVSLLNDYKKLGTKIVFNPTLVRGQDYYTGTIFELRHASLAGSLAGGGRYNRLLEIFGTQDTPAFGGSIGFERLYLLLLEQGKLGASTLAPQVFFPLFEASLRGKVSSLAASLRRKGIRADVFPDAAKLKNQFKYAGERKIPYVASLGGDELAKGIVKLKTMSSGEEKEIAFTDFENEMEKLCKA